MKKINFIGATKYIAVISTLFIFGLIFIWRQSINRIMKDNGNGHIKIAINIWPGYSYVFLAQEKGFFKKNGVDVDLVLTKEYSEAQELYKNGDVDGIFEVYSDTLFHNAEGYPTKVVYVVDYSDAGDVIIGKPDFDISEIKGKRIGIDKINRFSHLFALKGLEKLGVEEVDLAFVSVPALYILNALEEDLIDAGHTWEPIKSMALERGYKIILDAGDVPGIITDVLSFNPNVIEERSKEIQAIVDSLFNAREFLDNNRAEALKIMALAEDMSIQEMSDGLNGIHQLNWADNLEAMKKTDTTESLYGSGNIISRFYSDRGQLPSFPDFDQIIYPNFIKNAK